MEGWREASVKHQMTGPVGVVLLAGEGVSLAAEDLSHGESSMDR